MFIPSTDKNPQKWTMCYCFYKSYLYFFMTYSDPQLMTPFISNKPRLIIFSAISQFYANDCFLIQTNNPNTFDISFDIKLFKFSQSRNTC